jgi:hypothetical protein
LRLQLVTRDRGLDLIEIDPLNAGWSVIRYSDVEALVITKIAQLNLELAELVSESAGAVETLKQALRHASLVGNLLGDVAGGRGLSACSLVVGRVVDAGGGAVGGGRGGSRDDSPPRRVSS